MEASGSAPRPLILHTEASVGLGGQEIRTLAETRWLREHGWDALIACQPQSRLAAETAAAHLPLVTLRMRSALDIRALLALRRLIRSRAVALVHTHSSVDSWLATLAAKSLSRPVVRGRHVSIPIHPRRALIYRLPDRIITTGEAIKEVVLRAGVKTPIISIPVGVDTTRFHPDVSGDRVRTELGLSGVQVVGLVANVRGSKGHRYFLEAAREVLAVRPQTRFLIVGDGVGFDDVRRQVQELGLAPHVVMTGFRRDIPEIMAALDMLVLPSTRSEGTSQVVPQALAVGTPVVGTTVGGTPEVIRDGETGRLVPPGDAHALAQAILSLLADPAGARALGRAGQELVRGRYTFETMMERITAVYRELLGADSARWRPGGPGAVG
jgi:glycosyltransferase involved in cell wall biosynthesis